MEVGPINQRQMIFMANIGQKIIPLHEFGDDPGLNKDIRVLIDHEVDVLLFDVAVDTGIIYQEFKGDIRYLDGQRFRILSHNLF